MSFRSEDTGGLESLEKAGVQVQAEDVKTEWKLLWRCRIDDKVRAEGIANQDYSLLFVEQGTVIVATRDFKPLSLREILLLHEVQNVERVIPPHPSVGGWRKFARTVLNQQRRARRWERPVPSSKSKRKLQRKKGGRGWLHHRMNR
ncbi:MAG: hypothetical protein JSV29_00730 [Candidatus Bathyarchaeota archaeon]|nr:MAG: hypothetical protein JSV29_00730 [Candidatus Bathyarchaeota archaeon]